MAGHRRQTGIDWGWKLALWLLAWLAGGCTSAPPGQVTPTPVVIPPCYNPVATAHRRDASARLPGLTTAAIRERLAREDFSQFYDQDKHIEVIVADPRHVALIPDVAEDVRGGQMPPGGSCGTPLHTDLGICPGAPGIVERYKALLRGPFVAMNVSFFGEFDSRRIRAVAGDVVRGRQLQYDSLRFVPLPDTYHRMLLGLRADGQATPEIVNHAAGCLTAPFDGLALATGVWTCGWGAIRRLYDPGAYSVALTGLGDPYDPRRLPGNLVGRTVADGPGHAVTYTVGRVVVGLTPERRLVFAYEPGLTAMQLADRLAAPPYRCNKHHLAFLDGGSSAHVFVRYRNPAGRWQETELPGAGVCQNMPVWLVLARRSDVANKRSADFPIATHG